MTQGERERLVQAFKAGVEWCKKNGADHWAMLECDAEYYARHGEFPSRGGFVVARGSEA